MSASTLYADGTEITTDVEYLSKEEICSAGYPIKFGRLDHRSRSHLIETISHLSASEQDHIRVVAAEGRNREVEENADAHISKRRKTAQSPDQERTTNFVADQAQELFADTEFLKPQSSDVVEQCIASFIDRTGNKALATAICIVCARELAVSDTQLMSVGAIPNERWLVPQDVHPSHHLTNGMLLQNSALTGTATNPQGHVCLECLMNLKKNRLPRQALANNMWVGEVPFELAVLTLPERVLIARNFPAAHIVKLFPLSKGVPSTNCALRGNVSTYRLDMDEIADMVQGNIMPNPSQILASTIGVTIIGPKNVRERTMPGFLWVRRHRVRAALSWLQNNNPLYTDIIISDERLQAIARDGIPVEILNATRYSDDIEELERERAGYVPEDDEFEDESHSSDRMEHVSDVAGLSH